MKTNRLKILAWAAMHSPNFCDCCVTPPLYVRRIGSRFPGAKTIEITFCWPIVHVPWKVESAFNRAVNPKDDPYDDIPF